MGKKRKKKLIYYYFINETRNFPNGKTKKPTEINRPPLLNVQFFLVEFVSLVTKEISKEGILFAVLLLNLLFLVFFIIEYQNKIHMVQNFMCISICAHTLSTQKKTEEFIHKIPLADL